MYNYIYIIKAFNQFTTDYTIYIATMSSSPDSNVSNPDFITPTMAKLFDLDTVYVEGFLGIFTLVDSTNPGDPWDNTLNQNPEKEEPTLELD